jgi:PII-like signaling protein
MSGEADDERGTSAGGLSAHLCRRGKTRTRPATYQAIIHQARQMHMAGATVIRGTQGYGRSTRLHTTEVLFSDDLPIIIEMIDHAEKIDAMVASLDHRTDIALMTCETITLRGLHGLTRPDTQP